MNQKILPIIFLLILVSCENSALINPYSKAPVNHKSGYVPSNKEIMELSCLDVNEELLIPLSGIDNSLGDLFDIALNNSPSTRSSWLDAKAAAASYGESLSTYLPSLAFDGEFNANREGFIFNLPNTSSTFLMNNQIQYGPIISLSYLLFDGGERKAKAGKYFWLLQESNFLHNENVQSVMKTVANNYYIYLSNTAQYEADIEDLRDAEATYTAASDKYSAGIYAVTDMLQAKTNYLQKKVNLTNQKNLKENSYIALITTLGIPASSPLDLHNFPENILPCPFDMNLDELIKVAKKCRGEYLAAKSSYLSAAADVKIAEGEILPKLNLVASGGEYWYQGGFQDAGNYNVVLDLSFPIFSGFYYQNQIKNKKSLLAQAKSAMYSAELNIIEDVHVAMNNLSSAKEKILDTKSYLDAAEIEAKAMFKRYKLGIVTILDLLSAQSFLADAKAQYIVAQQEYYSGIVSVAFATGMLSAQNIGGYR